jgi:succinate dehydrogenase/fumarate reductase cytochrome b subunit
MAEPIVDKLILFFFIFHAIYGIRLILIDVGVKRDRLLFWAATIVGAILFCGLYWVMFAA